MKKLLPYFRKYLAIQCPVFWQALLLNLLLIPLCQNNYAQSPVVHSFFPANASVNEEITIYGTGFSNKSDLKIYFGAVAANSSSITESNSSAIKVMVPAGATFGLITVLDQVSGNSASSPTPFTPSFGGEDFSLDKLGPPLHYLANPLLYDLQLADLDGDGLSEIILGYSGAVSLSIYKNNSSNQTLSFSKTDIPAGGKTHATAYGDLNGNGKLDVVLSGSGTNSNFLYFLENQSTSGNISLSPPVSFPLSLNGAEQVSLYDINYDGKPDIVLTNTANNQVYIFRNNSEKNGSISFSASPHTLGLPQDTNSKGLAIADLDNDRKPEIAVTRDNGNVYIFSNKSSAGNISFDSPYTLNSLGGNISLAIGDIDGDGNSDIAVSNLLYSFVSVWLNNTTTSGAFEFGGRADFPTESRPAGMQLSDINGDGKTDIVVGHTASAFVSILINQSTAGNAQFTKHSVSGVEKNRQVRAGDLNGDGKPEIIYTSLETSKISILKNNICIAPKIFPEGNHVVCNGSAGSFTLNTYQGPGLSYQWKLNGTAISGAVNYKLDNISVSGDYTVEIGETNNPTCTAQTSGAVKVTIGEGSAVPEPEFYAILPTCEGEEIILRAKEMPGTTYLWSGPNNFTQTTLTPTVIIENAVPQMQGRYSLVIQSGPCSSLEVSQEAEVMALSVPVISYANSNTSVCNNASTTLTATAGFTSYKWFRNGQMISGASTGTYLATAGGSYTVEAGNGNCALESAAITLSDGNSPEANFQAPETACLNQPIIFYNKTTATINEQLVYNWDFGDGNTSSLESPSHTYANTNNGAKYTVSLKVRYQNSNCINTFRRTIKVFESTDIVNLIAPAGTEFCEGTSIPLLITGDAVNATWSNGATGLEISVNEEGTYTANVQTLSGCLMSKSVTLIPTADPVVEVVVDKTLIKQGETAQLQASGAIRYEWAPKDGLNDPFVANPIAAPTLTTTYTLTAYNEAGCSSQTAVTIELDRKTYVDTKPIFLPYEESYWVVGQIENYPALTLFILNRFGKTVYQAQPYQNQWDGREAGRVLDEGVYYFIFKDTTGKPVKTGSITIIH